MEKDNLPAVVEDLAEVVHCMTAGQDSAVADAAAAAPTAVGRAR